MDISVQEQKYITSFTFLVEQLNILGPYVLGMLLVIFVLWRTKSPFFFLYRIQSLIGGTTAFNDPRLQKHWKSYADKNHLNLWFGLGLKSSRAMHQLTSWLHRHSMTLDDVSRAVPYFNTNKLNFTFPSKRVLRFRKISIPVVAVLFVLTGALFTVPDSALLWIKKTHTLFWVNSEYAYSPINQITEFWGFETGWKIDNHYCLFKDDIAPLAEQWDKDVICYLVLGNRMDYVDEALQSQKYLGIYLLVVALIGSFGTLYLRSKMIHAREMDAKINATTKATSAR